MALWDAGRKAGAGVPCHALFGRQVRTEAPISWWCLDFTPEEWVEEARLALSLGYTSLKLKGRPWRDVLAQIEALEAVVPQSVLLDIDFNSSLANAATAVPYLRELEQLPATWPSSRRPSRRGTWPGTSRSGPRPGCPSPCTSGRRPS